MQLYLPLILLRKQIQRTSRQVEPCLTRANRMFRRYHHFLPFSLLRL